MNIELGEMLEVENPFENWVLIVGIWGILLTSPNLQFLISSETIKNKGVYFYNWTIFVHQSKRDTTVFIHLYDS